MFFSHWINFEFSTTEIKSNRLKTDDNSRKNRKAIWNAGLKPNIMVSAPLSRIQPPRIKPH